MGEFTRCNYCSLQSVERRAKREGWKVTKLVGWHGGTDVFMHPPNVKITKESQADDHPHQKFFRYWLMNVTDHCCC